MSGYNEQHATTMLNALQGTDTLKRYKQEIREDAITEMKDKLQLSAIYTETEDGWSGMTVDTIQIEEIANELKEKK